VVGEEEEEEEVDTTIKVVEEVVVEEDTINHLPLLLPLLDLMIILIIEGER